MPDHLVRTLQGLEKTCCSPGTGGDLLQSRDWRRPAATKGLEETCCPGTGEDLLQSRDGRRPAAVQGREKTCCSPGTGEDLLQSRVWRRPPVVQGLEKTYAYSADTPMGSPATPMRGSHQPSESFLNSSLISYEVHGESAAASTGSCEWVTVFGFPVASASFILTQFAQVGTIADQRLPGSGNWMHLRYQTPLEARKALALNGKILSSSIMIGVIPCTDASLLASTTKNLPLASSVSVGNTSASFAVNSPKAGIRSLTQSYAVTPTDNQVLTAASTPKKNDSFMSKAMQHILGV
ncbi:hypothetical protein HAZT_HAZT004688 [Hyalella azteca]|uniref:Nucleoporin NUP35 n=1 Tax=Hyalella azteca TaxID=294128 RepID=A0A6A0H629_HYAAZ|nr:hypothetical protein HAZT_HAZT004688 [Hyalella azteca]